MSQDRSFEIKGLIFTFKGGQLFLGDLRVSIGDVVRFIRGEIDLAPPKTITDVVVEASGASGFDTDGGDFDILREALVATGLDTVLADQTADFSVFAPTDDAFIQLARDLGATVADGDEEAALTAIVAALEAQTGSAADATALLRDILLYHVAPGGRTLDDLQGTVTTVQGGDVTIDGAVIEDAEPDLLDPRVIAENIEASNGIIQALDRVLLPIDLPGNDAPNVIQVAADSPDFTLLVRALSATMLLDTVRDAIDVTVFAPTNAAFVQLATDLGFAGDATDEDAVWGFLVQALTDLAPDGDPLPVLSNILLYHVSPGAKTADEVAALDTVPTLLIGATFAPENGELVDNEPDIDNPTITGPDIVVANDSLLQVIDRVLIPLDIPGNGPNIVDIAAGSDDFNILVRALDAAGLVDTVRGLDDVTVFAPTDAAFTQLALDLGFTGDETDETAVFDFIAGALAGLDPNGDPIPVLTNVLLYHVSPGAKTAAEVDALDAVPTLLTGATFGSDGTELIDNEPDIDNPTIAIPDIRAENGTIQAIDRVLIPLDIPGNGPNIVDIAAGSDDFNILVRALDAAGLVDTVRGLDDVTVFAPTDAAFTQLALDLGFTGDETDETAVFDFIAGALAGLDPNGDPIPVLTNVLLYHVSPGAKTAAEVDALDAVPTLLTGATFGSDGTELIDNEPDIDNPTIAIPDIRAANGTIQAIDRVLIPLDIPGNGPNIVDIAAGSDDFNILVRALDAAGLVDTVRGLDDVTVFAPTDAAFTQLALDLGFTGDETDETAVFDFIAGALAGLDPNGDPIPVLTNVLLYHVSPGAKTAAEVDALDAVPTLLTGATFGSDGTELIDNEPDIDNPTIAIPDIRAANGTIQAIDRVLIPLDIPGNGPNIVDIAAGSDDFNILVRALDAAGLVDTVRGLDDVTVFAPTDAAFTQLALDLGFTGDETDETAVFDFIAGALAGLDPNGDPIPVLTNVLLYHVSPGAKTAAEVDALDAVPTLLTGATFGSDGTELIDNEPDIDNPTIAIPDIRAENGTIQAIDRVLIPLDIPGNDMPEGAVIKGTFRSDHLTGTAGNDDISGFFGNDRIDGGGGDDIIKGGFGRDLLKGGAGDDHLFGGFGRDFFDFREIEGDDVVKDFSRWDWVLVSRDDFADRDAVRDAVVFENGDAILETSDGSITLEDVSAHDFNAHQFLLH